MVNDVSVDALKPRSEVRHLRKGNLFSQYTRKFSLGNGPADWVQEYLINKEGGKMLGTLIALTIARMPNLETMIWDMPTGIVREVWHALASLGDRREERGSRLEKVWVRLPDNREVTTLLPAPTASTSSNSAATLPTPNLASFSGDAASLKMSYERIEHPNFSILPPMKSLSVLEIDELAYLKELSVLVRRSYESIRELRLGISKSCAVAITQKPAISELSDSQCRALGCYNDGGILGLVLNEIYDCRKIKKASTTMIETSVGTVDAGENLQKTEYKTSSSSLTLPFATLSVLGTSDNKTASVGLLESPEEELSTSIEADSFQVATSSAKVPTLPTPHLLPSLSGATMVGEPQKKAQPVNQGLGLQVTNPSKCEGELSPAHADASLEERATASSNTIPVEEPSAKRLMLETLELERIPLSINVLQKTIDWSVLTAITLLDCGDHERLWKTLRRLYSPKSSFLTATSSLGSVLKQPSRQTLRRVTSTGFNALSPPEYRLNLRRIHTDSVSPALISFLKETLAPNSLEWMLLQEHGRYESPVTVDAICRGPLRHHRASLTKVLIDSGDIPSERGRSSKWKKWILNHDVLTFITSGKMSCLRELGMTLDHKDWVSMILGYLLWSG